MPTIGNLPGADLDVTFPSGETRTVNMLRLLVQTQNAEFKRDHGMFLPNVGKLNPTVKALVEAYELEFFFDGPVRTWEDCAAVMRHFYDTCSEHIGNSRIEQQREVLSAMRQALHAAGGEWDDAQDAADDADLPALFERFQQATS